jgi:transcriptional regulator with GAF, ATPase, and Fis domain/molybdopterin-guanine dinucleotide biosynthesis protein
LGLVRPYGTRGRIAGTPDFMAPEAWLGETSSASDIYALGVTVLQLLRGASESTTKESLSLSEHLAKALTRAKEAHDFADWVPASLKRVLGRMLASDPSDRLQSAREVAARFSAIYAELFATDRRDRIGGGADDVATPKERAMAAHRLPFEGHEQALKLLVDALSNARNDPPGIIAVIGPAGSGRSRLIREAVRRLQTAGVASTGVVASYRAALALPAEPIEHDIVLHLEQADAIELDAVRAFIRSTMIAGKRSTVILERQNAVADEIIQIALKPLSGVAIERLLNAAIAPQIATPALVEAALSASGGLSGRLCRTLIEGLSEGLDLSRPETLLDLAYKQKSEHHFIPESAQEFASLLACCGGSLSMRLIGDCLLDRPQVARGVQMLLVHGLATESRSGRIVLRPDLVAIRSPSQAVLRLIDRLLTSRLDAANRGYLFAAKGDLNRAFQGFIDAIRESRNRGDPENAARLAGDALQRLSRVANFGELYLAKADALRACGRYQQALQTLEDQTTPQAAIQRVELHRLRGDLSLARCEAEAVFESAQIDAEIASNGRALLARIAFDSNALDQAEALANGVSGDELSEVRALEVLALVMFYRGESAKADKYATRALTIAQRAADPALESRVTSVLASVASSRGEISAATERFRRAFELAERSGEFHAAAVLSINLGLAQLDSAQLGPALIAIREGARRLARLGREADLAQALYNLGNAAYLIGDDDLALSAIRQARRSASIVDEPRVDAYARLVEAEVLDRQGEKERLRERLNLFTISQTLAFRDRAIIEARCSVLWLALDEADNAYNQLQRALDALRHDDSDAAAIECAIAQAHYALSTGDANQAYRDAEKAYRVAQSRGAFEARLNATAIAVRAAEAAGQGAVANARAADLRTLLDQAARSLTPAQRAMFRRVAVYRRALEAMPRPFDVAIQRGTDDRWRKLAALAKRLTAEQRIGRLYDIVLDAAIELSGAERGFVVLRGREGKKTIGAARGIDRRDIERDENAFSRSIVARVIDQARPLATVDALSDERLDGAASVHALKLRSVLAVPLRLRAEVAGAIYLDDPLRPFAFGEVELALLTDLADLAAIALDGAERLRTERRAARRLEAMHKRLARTVEAQAVQLASLKQSSGENGYPGVIGDSPGMRRVFETVRRVAKSDLSVLILGESGTGKELVAKAIHDLGARAKAPFISENCSAIPEQLLESALFGHVKGAFTGADRRRLGLFEVADGGTLFLDEIGDMSLSMQSRLLRALEEGEVRPVGGERSRTVDVRVVAATHRDLEKMVVDKRFRDDLYYRLAVVSIVIPPLRDRREDIPALVAHFVSKHATQRQPRIDQRALDYLSRQKWPGNVRQLENAIRRALVLSDDLIREEHLFDKEEAANDRQASEFDLKAQIRDLETDLIRRALDVAKGNQTQAAKLLGLSRYGLQKMLKRIGPA